MIYSDMFYIDLSSLTLTSIRPKHPNHLPTEGSENLHTARYAHALGVTCNPNDPTTLSEIWLHGGIINNPNNPNSPEESIYTNQLLSVKVDFGGKDERFENILMNNSEGSEKQKRKSLLYSMDSGYLNKLQINYKNLQSYYNRSNPDSPDSPDGPGRCAEEEEGECEMRAEVNENKSEVKVYGGSSSGHMVNLGDRLYMIGFLSLSLCLCVCVCLSLSC